MPSTLFLAEIYILGDFSDDLDFRNAVLDDITTFAYDIWLWRRELRRRRLVVGSIF